jgi:hypothetical protein
MPLRVYESFDKFAFQCKHRAVRPKDHHVCRQPYKGNIAGLCCEQKTCPRLMLKVREEYVEEVADGQRQ